MDTPGKRRGDAGGTNSMNGCCSKYWSGTTVLNQLTSPARHHQRHRYEKHVLVCRDIQTTVKFQHGQCHQYIRHVLEYYGTSSVRCIQPY